MFSADPLFKMILRTVPLFFCGTVLFAAEVAVDRLNLRTEPSRESIPAGTVVRGTKLRIVSQKDGWAAVKAPETLPVWISSVFLRNGRTVKEARLRSGPGVFYPVYEGKLPEKFPVKILERNENGSWLRIAPPPQLICYVSSRFLTGLSQNETEAAPKKKTVPAEPHPVSIEGKLVPLATPVSGADYKLILELNGKIIPLCFLHSRSLNLKLWENRTIRIDGLQRWVGNNPLPFIEIEKVSPSWK